MPGLSIPIGGGRTLGGGPPLTGGVPPATIAQTAYGAGSAQGSGPGGIQHHHTVSIVWGTSLALLVFIRWSLPGERKRLFDLTVANIILVDIAWAGAGLWSRQKLMTGPASGVGHGTAVAVKALTP